MGEITEHFSFSVRLISANIMLIYVVVNDRIPTVLWLSNISFCKYTAYSPPTQLLTGTEVDSTSWYRGKCCHRHRRRDSATGLGILLAASLCLFDVLCYVFGPLQQPLHCSVQSTYHVVFGLTRDKEWWKGVAQKEKHSLKKTLDVVNKRSNPVTSSPES